MTHPVSKTETDQQKYESLRVGDVAVTLALVPDPPPLEAAEIYEHACFNFLFLAFNGFPPASLKHATWEMALARQKLTP